MQYTSAEINQRINDLNAKKSRITFNERKVSTYNAASQEDEEKLRQDYDFELTSQKIEDIDTEIMNLKHSLNVFNTITTVGNSGLTIDQVLILLPILRDRMNRLNTLMSRNQRERAGIINGIIDYVYTAYDPKDAAKAYENVLAEVNYLTTELAKINNTTLIEC